MIVGISGRKQSGKNTTANILHGIILKQKGFIDDWNIDALGHLHILNEDGWGYFDVTRKDESFVSWADNNMWPYVKLYSFADHLKAICMDLFDIPYRCLYGTEDEKNQVQKHLLWENMPSVTTQKTPQTPVNPESAELLYNYYEKVLGEITYHKPGPMTAREFMQFLGTDVMRKMYEPVWVNSCIKKIKREQSELAIIADIRFPNEAKAVENAGGKVVRLTRKIYQDSHSSEVALDNYPFTDYIDNKFESIDSLMVDVKRFYHNLKGSYVNNIC